MTNPRQDIMPASVAAQLLREMNQSSVGDNQSELSRVTYELFEVGVSQVTISRILNGDVVAPNNDTFRKLAAGIESRGGMPGVYERLVQAKEGRYSMRNHSGVPDELWVALKRAEAKGPEFLRIWLDRALRDLLDMERVHALGYDLTGENFEVHAPQE